MTPPDMRRISAAVVLQAVRDAQDGNGYAAEAREWLMCDPLADEMLAAVGIHRDRVLAWLESLPEPEEAPAVPNWQRAARRRARREMAVHLAKAAGQVTMGDMRQLFPEACNTVLRVDLRQLVEAGLLVRCGGGRGTCYVAAQ